MVMNIHNNTTLLIKAVLLACVIQAGASTIITPAGLLSNALGNAISAYLEGGGIVEGITVSGLTPRLNMEILNRVAKGDLWERFQIVTMAKVQDPESKNRILAVTSFRVSEDRHSEVGRYVVWMNANSSPPSWEKRVWVSWETQAKVDHIFRVSKLTLEDKGTWTQPNTKSLEGGCVK